MQGIKTGQAVYAQDEYGRHLIIVRDQQKFTYSAAKAFSAILKSSLGPRGIYI